MKAALRTLALCCWIGAAGALRAQPTAPAQDAPASPSPPSQSTHIPTAQERELQARELKAMIMLIKYRRGVITLTPDEVREYTAILDARRQRRASEMAKADSLAARSPQLEVHSLTLESVAPLYGRFAKLPVDVTDRAKKIRVSIKAAAETEQAMVPLIEASLRSQGIVITRSASAITLDSPAP